MQFTFAEFFFKFKQTFKELNLPWSEKLIQRIFMAVAAETRDTARVTRSCLSHGARVFVSNFDSRCGSGFCLLDDLAFGSKTMLESGPHYYCEHFIAFIFQNYFLPPVRQLSNSN